MRGRQMTDAGTGAGLAHQPKLGFGEVVEPSSPSADPAAARSPGALAHDFNNAIAILLLNAQLVLDQLLPDHPLRAELVELCAAAERASSLARQLVPGSNAFAEALLPPPAPATAAVQGGTVLVVEDDESVRVAVQRVLSSRGFRVLAAEDGAEAESFARAETIDLVLTDLDLPDLSGAELARRVCERHTGARVLFMSGSEPPAYADYFLQKPFTPQLLLRQVRLALEAAP